MDDPRMRYSKTIKQGQNLTRPLRVGLVGAPCFWSGIDFESWKSAGVELGLVAFVGNSEANRQDFLLIADEVNSKPSHIKQQTVNEFLVPELLVNQSDLNWLVPSTLIQSYENAINAVSAEVHEDLKQHGENYVGAEKVIAKYGTEITRVAGLFGKPQLHIENEALQYLINSPWRNARELEFAIARMAFYASDDVLRESYVVDKVYDFSTSIRGVFNAKESKPFVNQFIWDVVNSKCVKTTLELLRTKIEGVRISRRLKRIAKLSASDSHRKAA